MPKATPINLIASFKPLTRMLNRTPQTSEEESKESFALLSEFRDGGVFVASFGGNSEWERHSNGDELVLAVEGKTDLILYVDGVELRNTLREGELIVVPQNTWHRFETCGVKILTLTPQPTDHHSGVTPPL